MKEILVISFLFISGVVFAQNVPFEEEYFHGNDSALNVAKKNYEDGSIFFHNGKAFCKYNLEDSYCRAGWSFFEEGLPYLKKAYEINPNNAELNFKLGMTYYTSSNKYNAIPYIQSAYRLDSSAVPSLLYYMARLTHLNGEWERAILYYDQLINGKSVDTETRENVSKEMYRDWRAECQTALELQQYDSVKVMPMGESINTNFPEYGSAVLAGGRALLFTSKRDSMNVDNNFVVYEDEDEKIESVYLAYKRKDGWKSSVKLQSPINDSETHSSILAVAPNNKEVLIQKSFDIARSAFIDGLWEELDVIDGPINTNAVENSATFKSTSDSILFSSDRRGGEGGFDIYETVLDNKRETETVINLGETINSKYNETSVFYHVPTQTLFFSSNRLGTIGGYDIFYSKNVNGEWQTPMNLGLPFNSPEDDMYFSVNDDFTKGFVTSYRANTNGEKDIYELEIPVSFIKLFESEKEVIVTETEEVPPVETESENTIVVSTQIRFTDSDSHSVLLSINDTENSIIVRKDTVFTSQVSESMIVNLHTYTDNFEPKEFKQLTMGDDSLFFSIMFEEDDKLEVAYIQEEGQRDSITLEGIIVDAETTGSLEGELIVYDSVTNEVVASVRTSRSGKYSLRLPKERTYRVDVKSESHLNQSTYIAVPKSKNTATVTNILLSTDNPLLGNLYEKDDVDVSYEEMKTIVVDRPDSISAEEIYVEVYNAKTRQLVKRSLIQKRTAINVPADRKYSVYVKADGYATVQYGVNIPSSKGGVVVSPKLSPIKEKSIEKQFVNTVYFETNMISLSDSVVNIFKHIEGLLQSVPQSKLIIVGHADAVGNSATNMKLSEERAKVCFVYLTEKLHISKGRMQIEFAGEENPVADNSSQTGRAKNRRAEFFLLY